MLLHFEGCAGGMKKVARLLKLFISTRMTDICNGGIGKYLQRPNQRNKGGVRQTGVIKTELDRISIRQPDGLPDLA